MNQFADVLKANNLKSTHQRLTILQHVDQFGHVDIDTLYEAILKKYPTISKATLYRNINDLLSFHIIEEVKLPNLTIYLFTIGDNNKNINNNFFILSL